MDITDIIKNSFKYPFSDNKQFAFIFLTFVALGLFVGLSFALPVISASLNFSMPIALLISIILVIVSLVVAIIICGYQIDIIGVACDLEDNMPSFEPTKNIKNGLYLILIYLVFYILSGIISTIAFFLGFGFFALGDVIGISLSVIISLILLIIQILISWVFSMSLCRFAYYGTIGEALDLKEAYNDLKTIGFANMLIYVLAMAIIMCLIVIVVFLVVALISSIANSIAMIIAVLILFALASYLFVVQSRAVGLIYSKVIYD